MSATAPFYTDMSTDAVATSLARFSQPFAGDSGEYVLDQNFQQFLANFVPLPLNTEHPDYKGYYLVSESPLQHLDGGMVSWTRQYCSVPATRNDSASISYNFIGYYGKIADIAIAATYSIVGRNRRTEVVTCRIQNDYYMTGRIGSYQSPTQIPIIPATRYYVPQGNIVSGLWVPTYTPAMSPNDLAFGTDNDFIYDTARNPVTNSPNDHPFPGAIIPTIPCRQAYQTLVSSGGEIVAENSVVSRWRGNIYQRQTKYIVAK